MTPADRILHAIQDYSRKWNVSSERNSTCRKIQLLWIDFDSERNWRRK